MKTLHLLALAVAIISSERAHAYTLEVTSGNGTSNGFVDEPEETVTFYFCEGGTYCDADFEVALPAGTLIETSGETIQIPVDTGFVPTTLVIERIASASDAWIIDSVVWEGGENLLGDYAYLALEGETGDNGCDDGVFDSSHDLAACKRKWRFFNLNGADDYEYDVRVQACAGTSSSSVIAHFCSNSACDTTFGEEESVELEMSDEDGGWTTTSFPLSFNPLAVRLEEVDETWCADAFTFNLFPVIIGGSKDTSDFADAGGSIIFRNIQENGELETIPPTPAPVDDTASGESEDGLSEESPDDQVWLDAAWEVAVTVIGAMVVAAGAACGSFIWRRNRVEHDKTEASARWCRRPVSHDGPITIPGESVEDGGVPKQTSKNDPVVS